MICSLLQCLPCTSYIHGHFFCSYSLLFRPEDGSNEFLWNTGKYVPTSHPKRQSFSEELFLKKKLRAQSLYSQMTPEYSKLSQKLYVNLKGLNTTHLKSHYSYCCYSQLKSATIYYWAVWRLAFSPHQEIIFSFRRVIWFNSFCLENMFLLVFTLKLYSFRKMAIK